MTPRETVFFITAVILGAPLLVAALPWIVQGVVVYCVALGGCQ